MRERAALQGIQAQRPAQADQRIQAEVSLPEPPIGSRLISRMEGANLPRIIVILLTIFGSTVSGGVFSYDYAWSGVSPSASFAVDQQGRQVPQFDIRGQMLPRAEWLVEWYLFNEAIKGIVFGFAVGLIVALMYFAWTVVGYPSTRS
jgi:hypothetical protein